MSSTSRMCFPSSCRLRIVHQSNVPARHHRVAVARRDQEIYLQRTADLAYEVAQKDEASLQQAEDEQVAVRIGLRDLDCQAHERARRSRSAPNAIRLTGRPSRRGSSIVRVPTVETFTGISDHRSAGPFGRRAAAANSRNPYDLVVRQDDWPAAPAGPRNVRVSKESFHTTCRPTALSSASGRRRATIERKDAYGQANRTSSSHVRLRGTPLPAFQPSIGRQGGVRPIQPGRSASHQIRRPHPAAPRPGWSVPRGGDGKQTTRDRGRLRCRRTPGYELRARREW